MIKVIHTILLSLLLVGQVNFAYAQTASILPNAKTTFLDSNGKPLVGGKVQFYVPGTTSPKTTWQDSGETIPNTNPVILDGAGRAIILGDGNYRQVVTDRLGNLIWDQATSSTGTGGGGTTATVGDGDAVGTVKPWSGLIAPNAYVFSYGQELARASFPLLFSTITTQQNVGCTSGNATLTGLGDTSQIPVGAPVESICLNAGATVVSTTISTITVSSNAIITTNSSARIFPFGNGDGSSTFNVPDLRGRVIAGRDNMGSVAANRLTSAATGFNAIAALGATGGNQSKTLVTGNLPAYTPSGSIVSTLASNIQGANLVNTAGGSNTATPGSSVAVTAFITVNQSVGSTFSGNAQGGTSTAFGIVQPTDILNYIIKTLPDSNPNSFFGVASIGGMTGILLCGTGITCSGNTISAISSVVPTPTAITLGGVFSLTCLTSNWFYQLDATGTFGCRQPNFTDLVGSIATSQIPTNTITDTQLTQGVSLSLLGNATNATANKTDIAATANSSCVYRENTSALACGSINLAASGTVGSSLLPLANGGLNAAIAANNGGIFWSNATQAQLLAGTATARLPLLSGATATPLWGAFTLPATVTSGGVACFTSATAMASSIALTANAVMLGAGAGACPTPLGSLGTTTTVLHGNASGPPSFGAVVTGDIGANAVANNQLAQAPATTLKSNPTGATANEQDITLGSTLNFSGTTLNCTSMSATQIGCGQPDNSTIVISGGKLTAVGAAATSIGILATTISSGTNNAALFVTSTGCSGTPPCLAQIGPGVVGQALISGGSGGSPSFKSGAWVLLNTLTASNSASLQDTTSISSVYTEYEIVAENILPATASQTVQFQVQVGGTFQTSSYLSANVFGNTTSSASEGLTTGILFGHALSLSNAGPGQNGRYLLSNPGQTLTCKWMLGEYIFSNGVNAINGTSGGCYNGGSGAITGVQLIMSSGNITSGVLKIYGRVN